MRFDAHSYQHREITDPELGFSKTVTALVFHVVELEGEPVSTVFSLISEKGKRQFEPYLAAERYRRYRFTVIKEGTGFVAPRIMSATPI